MFFFFKQKTAYEMRISDWSSDVCSSDLAELQQRLGNQVVEAPEAYGDDALAVQEHMSLFAAVSDAVIQYQFFVGNRLPTKKRDNREGVFDWSLGSTVASLPGAADADYGLFIFTQDAYGSTGRKIQRSEERRVGKECVSPCISRWSAYN